MTREDYKKILLSKGFVFVKSQMGFPGRGEEDVYHHPSFRYNFYVTHAHKSNPNLYGFYTGDKNSEYFKKIIPQNTEDDFRKDKALKMWTGDTFVQLMNNIEL